MNSTDLLTIVQRSKLALERLAALDISGASIPTDLIAQLRELAVYIDTTATKNHGTVIFSEPLQMPTFQNLETVASVNAAYTRLCLDQHESARPCGCDPGAKHVCAEHLEELRRATAVLPNLPTCPECGSTLTSIGDPEQLTYCDTCDREVIDPT